MIFHYERGTLVGKVACWMNLNVTQEPALVDTVEGGLWCSTLQGYLAHKETPIPRT